LLRFTWIALSSVDYERMHRLPLVPETLLEPDILLEPVTVDEFYQHQYQVIVGED
jgi:hypothetical protein